MTLPSGESYRQRLGRQSGADCLPLTALTPHELAHWQPLPAFPSGLFQYREGKILAPGAHRYNLLK